MLGGDSLFVRLCPKCGGERPERETQCENVVDGVECSWSLLEEPLRPSGGVSSRADAAVSTVLASSTRFCVNGHALEDDDHLCMACGAGPAVVTKQQESPAEPATPHEEALVAEAAAVIQDEIRVTASVARRRAVLAGLASLGYEVRETMASIWEREGRIVVRKLGMSDYGVELGAPADVSRLQVRLVGSDHPSAPRDSRRDMDQETIWCSEFDQLKAELAGGGNEIIVEKALLPGEQRVKSVSMPQSIQIQTMDTIAVAAERRLP